MSENNFELASRKKLRFETEKGLLSTEDLWDLPLTGRTVCLDNIAKALFKELKESADEVSFVSSVVKDNKAQLMFDIVKHIIDVKVAERDAQQELVVRRQQKQKVLELIAQREDGALGEMSLEDLRKMAESFKDV